MEVVRVRADAGAVGDDNSSLSHLRQVLEGRVSQVWGSETTVVAAVEKQRQK